MLELKSIDGLLLRDMIVGGAALLEKNREAVDALNVFPVPDGDTGTNMSLTMKSAVREANLNENPRACDAAAAFAKGALKGARGNSGVITSQLLRGFARGLEGLSSVTPVQFAKALQMGAETAYKAVMKPKEGTILTVARVIAEAAVAQAEKAPDDYEGLMQTILTQGEAILRETQNMLPALTQAGVVDAGGRGLLVMYTGYNAILHGETIDDAQVTPTRTADENFVDDHDSLEEITFAYCTEFIIQNLKPEVTTTQIDSFRRRLSRMGDCVLVIGDLGLVKVHVHTNNPGKALEFGLELGELVSLKIENMVEQRRERLARQEAAKQKEPAKQFGMVAVCQGTGFGEIFTELTVDRIVDGGQSMNPSIEDLANAINSINAKEVFVFPNNGNVILAAQQAAQLSEKTIHVIPTKNVAMGIAAAIAFQPEASGEENVTAMTEASEHVRTAMVTYAVRDSEFGDMHISQGDIIGLYNGKIEYKGTSVPDVVENMMSSIVTDEDSLITVYYGADTKEEEARMVTDKLAAAFEDCDVDMHMGGQPLYYYLISVE